MSKLYLGGAAGFAGDRIDAALPVAQTIAARLREDTSGASSGALLFEMLAERTLALAQLERMADPQRGYSAALEPMVRPVLKLCVDAGIRIIGNFGAANPVAAAKLIRQIAAEQGLGALRIAVVEGDELCSEQVTPLLPELGDATIISANVYQGAWPIADALRAGAQVVVTGRVADPALALGPAIEHFNLSEDDWPRLAAATIAGHLLECGAQVSGGYFADPGLKDVPDLAHVGYPIAELDEGGRFVITKADHTGGRVDLATVKEQLLYEMHDPAAYRTPDVITDITALQLENVGRDRVRVSDVRGHARPETLKVMVCLDGGWFGEGEISYAGTNAQARARLAAAVVRERVSHDVKLRFDLIGTVSVLGDDANRGFDAPASAPSRDVRLRVCAADDDRAKVEATMREVLGLYCAGPGGGGGVRTAIKRRLTSCSCLIPRHDVPATFRFFD